MRSGGNPVRGSWSNPANPLEEIVGWTSVENSWKVPEEKVGETLVKLLEIATAWDEFHENLGREKSGEKLLRKSREESLQFLPRGIPIVNSKKGRASEESAEWNSCRLPGINPGRNLMRTSCKKKRKRSRTYARDSESNSGKTWKEIGKNPHENSKSKRLEFSEILKEQYRKKLQESHWK